MFAHLNMRPTFYIHYVYISPTFYFLHELTLVLSRKLTFNYSGSMDFARFKVTTEDNNCFGTW